MKKLLLILLFTISAFSFDLTFMKAFNNFNRGTNIVKSNPQKANQYFQKTFFLLKMLKQKDTSQVNYMLGKMYSNGWGVKQNYQKAQKYFLRAIQLGNKRANCSLAKLYIKTGDLTLAKKYLNYTLSNPDIANYCSDIDTKTLTIKGETK